MKCKCGHELIFDESCREIVHLHKKEGNITYMRWNCPFCKCENPEPEEEFCLRCDEMTKIKVSINGYPTCARCGNIEKKKVKK